jgi:enoyl-CoA hydratase/carnithine racemase
MEHYPGPMLKREFVHLEITDGVATMRLDRPPMNALSTQVQQEMRDVAREIAQSSTIGAVVVYGGPKIFAAGADVKEMSAMDYQEMVRRSAALQDAFSAVAAIPQPTIAAITGYALGGGLELALCCDFRVAGDNVKVGQPEILLGIIPGAGGTQRLPRLIGLARAKDLIFSGRFVAADEAHAMGLLDRVVAPDDVHQVAVDWASQLARGPALALRAAKQVIDSGTEVDLANGLELERLAFMALFATEDRRIGMESFIEHGPGKAEFTGR